METYPDKTMKPASRLKCKFCDWWTTTKAFSTASGNFRGVSHAHQRLLDHVFDTHPAEYEQVQDALNSVYEGDHP